MYENIIHMMSNPVIAGNTHSISLNGTNQYLSVAEADKDSLDMLGDTVTVEGWFYSKTTWNTYQAMLGIPGATTSPYVFAVSGGSVVLICASDGTGTKSVRYDTANYGNTYLNKWVHVAMTVNLTSKTYKIYLDGVSVALTLTGADNTTTSFWNSTLPFDIGVRSSTLDGYFNGYIDEVRVWNIERTPAQILANYNKQLIGNEAGLVMYNRLNNNLNDSSPKSNIVTAFNSPIYTTITPF